MINKEFDAVIGSVINPSIQIVDDDSFMLILLKEMLLKLGVMRVETSTSTQWVLEQIATDRYVPDVMLLDLNMPDMDGLAYIRALASVNYQGYLAFISGADVSILRASVKLAKFHGFNVLGYLHKPVEPLELSALLYDWRSSQFGDGPQAPLLKSKKYSSEDLSEALRNGDIINYYQPKVELTSGQIRGVEALARWKHPVDGIIGPDTFIPLAEQHGLIDELTRQVVLNASTDICRWRLSKLPCSPVAINISMESLGTAEFMSELCSQIDEATVTPKELSFEITESRLLEDTRNPLEILARLRLHHFDVSLDDFGTGYATFSHLADFPFTELKVDRRFVHNGSKDRRIKKFYRACINIAGEFGLNVVAEGVENREDWDFVRAFGGNYAQGFFIARPMPVESLNDWVVEWNARLNNERLLSEGRAEYEQHE